MHDCIRLVLFRLLGYMKASCPYIFHLRFGSGVGSVRFDLWHLPKCWSRLPITMTEASLLVYLSTIELTTAHFRTYFGRRVGSFGCGPRFTAIVIQTPQRSTNTQIILAHERKKTTRIFRSRSFVTLTYYLNTHLSIRTLFLSGSV